MLSDRQLDHRMDKYLDSFKIHRKNSGNLTLEKQRQIEGDLSTSVTLKGTLSVNSIVTFDNIVHLTQIANSTLNISAFKILLRHYTPKAELKR